MRSRLVMLVVWLIFMSGVASAAQPQPPVPSPGKVTMVEVGANKCIPCKMMAPIIAELRKEYAGTVSIVFMDVWESPDAQAFARQAGVRGIPTQIFYDRNGKEYTRHSGYFDKQSIVEILTKLGAKPVAVPTKR